MQKFNFEGGEFAYTTMGTDEPVIMWAHGWGHTHKNLMPFIETLQNRGRHIALDFPGFGKAPEPPEYWGTKEHADAIAAWIKDKNLPPVIWVGHSYGCRIGTQLAAHYPACVRAMVYIGGAGLKRPRPLYKKIYLSFRIRLFKILRRLVPDGSFKQKIMMFFGSTDYNSSSGVMRKLFVRVVNEDLVKEAEKIVCPVTLIYGSEDTETPPSIGKKYVRLIKDSKLHILEGQDHYSILQNGRHRVIKIISDFIKELPSSS